MSSKKFVSCFKLHGVPLLPPILSEKEKRECRLYLREAMLIEKEIELKRKEEELERLRKIYQSSSSRPNLPEDYNEWSFDVLCTMVNTLCQGASNLEEFKYLFSEVTRELKDELKNLGYLRPSQSSKRTTSKNCDSTYHDVESLTFSHNEEPRSSNSSVIDNSTCFDRDDDKNSVIFTNEGSCHSEQSHGRLSTPLIHEKFSRDVSSSNKPNDHQDISFPSSSISDEHSPGVLSNSFTHRADNCENDGMQTPPKLIRRNSYTLDTPSPSVLAYLRNLSLNSPSEKNTDRKMNTPENSESTSKSAVRNLNNVWTEESSVDNKAMTSGINDDLNNAPRVINVPDKNRNFTLNNNENSEYLALRNEPLEDEHNLFQNVSQNLDEEKKLRAAVTIQAAARGFLVRRIMKTQRVDIIKNTIKEAVLCAWELYKEHAITPLDLQLHERIIQQVTAACYELHSIFFKWSTTEKMALIRADRERLKNPKPKFRPSRGNSESESSSSSRSTSKTRLSISSKKSEKVTGRRIEVKRPTSLPTVPRTPTPNLQTCSR